MSVPVDNKDKNLKQYHSSLASIEQRYRDLQQARVELVWYESKLAESRDLMAKYGLGKTPETIELQQVYAIYQLERDLLLENFDKFQKTLKDFQAFQGNLQHQLSNIQRDYESDLKSLQDELLELKNGREDAFQQLALAKTVSYFYCLSIVGVTIIAAAIFRDLGAIGIAALATCLVGLYPAYREFHNIPSLDRPILMAIFAISKVSERCKFYDAEIQRYHKYIVGEEENLRQRRRSHENQLRKELEDLRLDAFKHLRVIQAFEQCARNDATELKPQYLQDEWCKQQQILNGIFETLQKPVKDWQDTCWQDYTASTSGSTCSLYRIGELLIEREQGKASVPAILALRAHSQTAKRHWSGNVAIFSNDGDSRQAALQAIESLAVRAIAVFPTRTIKGVFIDPINAGNTFPFRNFPEWIVGKQTYTRSEDIREQLRTLAQHVEQVVQHYLSRDYEMIEDYNADSGAITEAYRHVFVADFPSGFDQSAIEDLKSLLLNGARAGVYVTLHIDDTLEKPRDFRYDIFDEYCTILRPAYGLSIGGSFKRPGSLKVGYIYLGRVTRILHSGAFVEFLPGKEGMLPTAQMTEYRIQYPSQGVSVGQTLAVKINSIDSQDRATLTCLGIQDNEAHSAACLALQTEDFQYEGVPLFTLQLPSSETFRIRLDSPPDSSHFNQIAGEVGRAVQSMPTDVVPFERLYPGTLWASKSKRNLCAPIGMAGAKDKLEFLVGMYEDGTYEPAHALLAGTTGSGKSYTLHAIILSLSLHYSPDEFELYLLDYKEGVEFQVYVTPDRHDNPNALNDPDQSKILPHARVISIESDPEFGLSVLERAVTEIEARGKAFKSVGASGLETYREKTGKVLPRLLIVIDEYQQMYLQADSRLCERLNDAIETITKQGRSFGVHLLLASQSPRIKDFRERIYEQMAVRMAMNMSRSTASILMAEGNTDVVELLDRAGKLAYNDRLGEKNCNRIGQVAFINTEVRQKAMYAILQAGQDNNFQKTDPTVVFNGIQPAKLRHNSELEALAHCQEWLPSRELTQKYLQEKDWISPEKPCATWLGESMRIGRQVRAIFRQRARNHLLLIGSNESEIFGILGGLLVGLVHTSSPESIAFQVADLSLSEGNISEVIPSFRNYFSSIFEIEIGKRFADKDENIVRSEKIWREVIGEFDRRQDLRQVDPDEMNFGKSLFFVLALGNLSQMDCFRPVAGRSGDEMSSSAKKLLEIASKGSELGIHLVLWLSDFKIFQQLFGGSRSAIAHFDLRVALRMNERNSQDFLGENVAKNLRDSQAYFVNAAIPESPEKFRPYAISTSQLLHDYAVLLADRRQLACSL
jgi:DNA segregation ATPase FtsK/SpoIIIE, S-DNA-T family